MASKATTASAETENLPATQNAGSGVPSGIKQISDDLAQEFEDSAGAGLSDNVDDRGTPLVYLAQKNTKQVDKQLPQYVKGLEVGMAFNSLTNEYWDAEGVGLPFLPCFFRANWIEWTPREQGGGFHGMYPYCDFQEAMRRYRGQQNGDRRDQLILDNGHELHLTHHYFGILPDTLSAVIIPMASTNLKASQQIQALTANARVMVNGKLMVAPSFLLPWRMKSVYATNDAGSWYRWNPIREGSLQDESTWTPPELRAICRDLYHAAKNNEIKMADPKLDDGVGGVGGDAGSSENKVPI